MSSLEDMAESPQFTGPAWTGDHVCDLFVRARRSFNGRVVLAAAGGLWDHGRPSNALFPPGPEKVLGWLQRYASDEPRKLPGHRWGPSELDVMREYLRCRAHGLSINEFVAAKGKPWRGFDRIRRRVCDRVAADLIRRGVPWFDLDERGRPVTAQCDENIRQVCA